MVTVCAISDENKGDRNAPRMLPRLWVFLPMVSRSAKQETDQGLDVWREDLSVVKMPGQKYTSGIDSCHQW